MKIRIISAAVGLGVMAVVFFFFYELVFDVAMSIVSILAVYELLVATKYIDNKALSLVSMTFAASVPFFRTPSFNGIARIACFVFVIVLLMIMFIKRDTVTIEKVALIFFISLIVPISLCSILYIRNEFPEHAKMYVLYAIGGAWVTDAGAYFIGRFFGKHKLAPTISPKKTIEGSIGGLIICIIIFLLATYIYTLVYPFSNSGITISASYFMVVLLSILLSIAGMIGDLTASIVKRQCSIKDFGSIMPGHGGILDRFDSVLFTAPIMYLLLSFCGNFIFK